MKKRGNRDEMVIATKYTTNFQSGPKARNVMANFCGTGSKSLHTSVEASLKKFQTDYIDLVSTQFPIERSLAAETDRPFSSTCTGGTMPPLSQS